MTIDGIEQYLFVRALQALQNRVICRVFCSDLAGWEEAGPGVALLPLRYDGPGRGQTTLNHLAELLVPATKISYVTLLKIQNKKIGMP